MSRHSHEYPEMYEGGRDPWDDFRAQADHLRKAERENAMGVRGERKLCVVCAERFVASPRIHCRRCEASLEEDRLNRGE